MAGCRVLQVCDVSLRYYVVILHQVLTILGVVSQDSKSLLLDKKTFLWDVFFDNFDSIVDALHCGFISLVVGQAFNLRCMDNIFGYESINTHHQLIEVFIFLNFLSCIDPESM